MYRNIVATPSRRAPRPMPSNFQQLQRNLTASNITNCESFQEGVGGKARIENLFIHERNIVDIQLSSKSSSVHDPRKIRGAESEYTGVVLRRPVRRTLGSGHARETVERGHRTAALEDSRLAEVDSPHAVA